ncbi:cingulin-like protein 1 isoform X2 [Morone saxatilis]|uniref:cingulin-like protein 1 isoform X2 n=1 Tax=Morone saxatilis TaxID=34816 RepID=UPI0015E24DDA|nr:cingulin-like protein 1 isoform X2 [Morone saxatilis]
MADRSLFLREGGHTGGHIPSGRQLHRTPPLPDVKRHLDFSDDDPSENMEAGTRDEANDQNRTFDFNTLQTKTEPDDSNSMLKGMTGYEPTKSDLEFIEKMKQEKLLRKLQRDLEEVQRLLKKETMAADLACASLGKAQAELKKFPSCEELTEWVKVVLQMTSPSAELTDLDAKSLLAMVTKENIQRAIKEKMIDITRLEKMVANKRKKESKEREQLEKQMSSQQLKIRELMSQLTDLKSELEQIEEAYKEMLINTQEAPENNVEADTSEELQATRSQAQPRGKGRKKAVVFSEKVQDVAKSESTKTNVKGDHAKKNTSETLKTKQKSGAAAEKPAKSVKAAREPQKKVAETESNPQESVQAVRGRRKPPGATQAAASQPKNRSSVRTGEAQSTSQQAAPSRRGQKAAVAADDAGEEAQNASLRRSKRIANRR